MNGNGLEVVGEVIKVKAADSDTLGGVKIASTGNLSISSGTLGFSPAIPTSMGTANRVLKVNDTGDGLIYGSSSGKTDLSGVHVRNDGTDGRISYPNTTHTTSGATSRVVMSAATTRIGHVNGSNWKGYLELSNATNHTLDGGDLPIKIKSTDNVTIKGKGVVFHGTTAGLEVPGLGSAGQVLAVASGGTTVEWATASGGSSNTAGDGIDITGGEVSVALGTNKGLEFTGGHLGVKLDGTTLTAGTNGLKVTMSDYWTLNASSSDVTMGWANQMLTGTHFAGSGSQGSNLSSGATHSGGVVTIAKAGKYLLSFTYELYDANGNLTQADAQIRYESGGSTPTTSSTIIGSAKNIWTNAGYSSATTEAVLAASNNVTVIRDLAANSKVACSMTLFYGSGAPYLIGNGGTSFNGVMLSGGGGSSTPVYASMQFDPSATQTLINSASSSGGWTDWPDLEAEFESNSGSVGSSGFTVPTGEGGKYIVHANLSIEGVENKIKKLSLKLYNDSTVVGYGSIGDQDGPHYSHQAHLHAMVDCSAGDVLSLKYNISLTGNDTVVTYKPGCRVSIHKIA